MSRQKLIMLEGPDGSGKSTLAEYLLEDNQYKLLPFSKRNKDGSRFEIKSRNDVNIFESMLECLDTRYTYILDRGYISNYVYGLLRNEPDIDDYLKDLYRLLNRHFVKVVPLTRKKIDDDFEDDLIKLTKSEFNSIIDWYNDIYENILGLTPVDLKSNEYDYSLLEI